MDEIGQAKAAMQISTVDTPQPKPVATAMTSHCIINK